MDFTSYNTFPKPDNREAFGDEYRQWADDLDVLARKEGPIADRPASAPTGAIYDATDQQVRYRYDGSAWGVIGGIGSAAKPLPSVNTEELSVTNGGSVRLDMAGTRYSVPSGESVTIPDGYSEVVIGPYDLEGELTVNGRMEIL